jgi:hypothetical protein
VLEGGVGREEQEEGTGKEQEEHEEEEEGGEGEGAGRCCKEGGLRGGGWLLPPLLPGLRRGGGMRRGRGRTLVEGGRASREGLLDAPAAEEEEDWCLGVGVVLLILSLVHLLLL